MDAERGRMYRRRAGLERVQKGDVTVQEPEKEACTVEELVWNKYRKSELRCENGK